MFVGYIVYPHSFPLETVNLLNRTEEHITSELHKTRYVRVYIKYTLGKGEYSVWCSHAVFILVTDIH
jgi:hypothetical protein